jgi:multidrug resistance efflux pump
MTETLYALAVLACPVGMGLMMWLMMRGGHRPSTPDADHEQELAQLRADVERLRAAQEHSGDRASSAPSHAPDHR